MGDFIDGDCGGPSASVSLASHFTRDKGLKDEGLIPGSITSTSDTVSSQQLVNEFLDETLTDITSPFHMGSLLNQMQAIEQGPKPVIDESSHWTQEFFQGLPQTHHPHLQVYSSLFLYIFLLLLHYRSYIIT